MKPTLYLHIGRPKTGSTALQHFLMKNRGALLDRSILYPLTGSYQLSSHLFAYAYSDALRESAALPPIDRGQLWSNLADEVNEHAASSVILSSENFWFVDPAHIAEDIGSNFDVRVIAYIRRQDNVVASSFCEEVKRELITLDADVNEYALYGPRLQLLDYLDILDAWSAVFGVPNTMVRVYERVADNGIAQDFSEILSIDPSLFEIDPSAKNPGLPYDVLALISNARSFKSGDAAKRRFVTALSESIVMLDYAPQYDAAGLFPQSLRERILAKFDRSNAKIGEKYLPGHAGELFPALASETYITPSKDMDPERIAQLLLGLQANQEKSNIRFLRRLSKLERQLEKQASLVESLLKSDEHSNG